MTPVATPPSGVFSGRPYSPSFCSFSDAELMQ